MVRRKYQQEYDIAPPITFGADHVALDIPDDGVQTDNGWEIVPVQRTQVNSSLLAFQLLRRCDSDFPSGSDRERSSR